MGSIVEVELLSVYRVLGHHFRKKQPHCPADRQLHLAVQEATFPGNEG